MLFTWDYRNVCVVFRQWQITSPLSLFITLAAIVGIVAGYEALRESIRRYEASVNQQVETTPRKYFLPSFLSPDLHCICPLSRSLAKMRRRHPRWRQ